MDSPVVGTPARSHQLRGVDAIFTDLAPGLSLAELSLQLIEIESRDATTIVERPTAANGFSTVIDFNDNSLGALEIYIAPA